MQKESVTYELTIQFVKCTVGQTAVRQTPVERTTGDLYSAQGVGILRERDHSMRLQKYRVSDL